MKIISAPDSFKGSLSAMEVATAIEEGARRVFPDAEIDKIPVADGGEGTVQSLVSATDGRFYTCQVKDPIGDNIKAQWGMLGDGQTAVIEMAAASGLPLVLAEKLNPLETTTFGTGQLILDALEKGCRKIILGIGGSATTDFGAGVAQALGIRFYHTDGNIIEKAMNGRLMGEVARIDTSNLNPLAAQCKFFVACDVDNPLLGPDGAVYTYSPQKGATPQICAILERNMEKIANITKEQLGDVRNLPGAGAAGGLGGGMVAFLNAKLQRGVKLVLDACDFKQRINGATLIITGEGKIDRQTSFGKTISGVAKEAQEQNVPVIAIAGSVDADSQELQAIGLTACFSICNKPMDLATAMKNTKGLITKVAEQVMRLLAISNNFA